MVEDAYTRLTLEETSAYECERIEYVYESATTIDMLRQGCESNNIRILKGSVGVDHVHMLLSCPTTMSPSEIMQNLKGRTSRILQEEFPALRKKYWGQHMWARGYFCGTVGEVDKETIERYIENQGKEETRDDFTIVEE